MGSAPSRESDWWDWRELRVVALRETQRVLACRSDAEDAAQEAIIRAYRSRTRCNSPSAPQAWVRTIAQREAYRLYGTRQPTAEGERISAEDHVEDEADSVIERLATWSALDRIQPADRGLIVRRYVLEQSSAQIATQLAIPAATVRVRLHRALKRLREEDLTP